MSEAAQPVPLHPGSMLGVAANPARMEAIKVQLNDALNNALARNGRTDTGNQAALLSVAAGSGDEVNLTVEFIDPVAQAASLRPVLRTIDVVAAAIYPRVKDALPQEDGEFDDVVSLARQALEDHKVHPDLAVLLVETALAAIHPQAFANRMVCTLYADGRLMVLTTEMLCRLLQDPARYPAQAKDFESA